MKNVILASVGIVLFVVGLLGLFFAPSAFALFAFVVGAAMYFIGFGALLEEGTK